MTWFDKIMPSRIKTERRTRSVPEGLWIKCPACDAVVIEATANAFLHHMMRNIAGLLIAIGRGDRPLEFAGEVLAGRDRTRNAATAPAAGLYLLAVRYPPAFTLPPPRVPGVFLD